MKQNDHPFVRHLEEVVQNYMQLIDKIIVISEDKITLSVAVRNDILYTEEVICAIDNPHSS
jgi:hypothetical protein